MSELGRILASGASWFATRPRSALGVALGVIGLSVLGISRIDMASSLSDMIGSDSPSSRAMVRIAEQYHTSDELVVLATLTPDADSDVSTRLEQFGRTLVRAIESDASDLVASVRFRQEDSFAWFARDVVVPSLPFYMTDRGFEEFKHRLTREGMDRQLARAEAMFSAPGAATGALVDQTLRDPLRLAELVDRSAFNSDGGRSVVMLEPEEELPLLLSTDGRTLMIRITGERQVNDLPFSRALTDRITALTDSIEQDSIQVELAGGYAIAATTSRGIQRDLTRSILVAVVLVHALFFVLYRHPMAPFVVTTFAALGILAGFGVQSVGHAVITPLSASIGAMLAGLGVDYGVHLLSHYQAARPDAPDSAEASRCSVRLVGMAILASGLTTAIGFGSMVFSGVTMLRGFAFIGVACVIGCLASVLLLMPASLRFVDHVRAPRAPRLLWVAGSISRRWRSCLLAGLVIVGAQIIAIGTMGWLPRMETDLSTMHPRPNQPLRTTESLASRFEGAGEWLPIEVRGKNSLDMLTTAHDIDIALTGEDEHSIGIVRTFGVHTLVPHPMRSTERAEDLLAFEPEHVRIHFEAAVANSLFNDDAFAEYGDTIAALIRPAIPEVRDIRAFPMISGRLLPDVEATEAPRSENVSAETHSLLVVQIGDSLADRGVRDEVIEGIRRLLEPFGSATLSGVTAVAFDLERATRGDLARLVLTAGGLIVGCLLVILRRPSLVVLALIPMTTGALTMLAAMLTTGMSLNALNGAAVPLLLGITVDAGVILVAYWAGQRSDHSVSLGACVQAVLAASLTTLVGFGAVCLSSTPAIRSLGMLTCLGVLGSIFGTLFVLVPILTRLTPESATTGTDDP